MVNMPRRRRCIARRQGRFAEALAALRQGHRLGTQGRDWPYPSGRWVEDCQRLVELDGKLPAVLGGTARPEDARQQLEFARVCSFKRRYGAAARLATEAFAARPELAEDLQAGGRDLAARAAARAAAGQGEDAGRLPDRVVLTLRRQALRWLRADLGAYAKLAGRADPKRKQAVRLRLTHWLRDADLAPVRDKEALARLPEGERAAWRRLWDDVEAQLKSAQADK